MKIYQVEIQTQDKSDFALTAMSGNHRTQFQLTHKTFSTKEKALVYLEECKKAYQFLQGAAGLGRLQHMNFVIKEHDIED